MTSPSECTTGREIRAAGQSDRLETTVHIQLEVTDAHQVSQMIVSMRDVCSARRAFWVTFVYFPDCKCVLAQRWGFSLCDEWNNMGRSTGLGLYSQAAAVKKGSGWWDRPLGNPSHTLTACRDRTYWHVLRCEWMDSKVCLGVCVLGWGQWGVDHQYPGTTDMSRAIALKTCEKETAVIFILTVPFTEIQD